MYIYSSGSGFQDSALLRKTVFAYFTIAIGKQAVYISSVLTKLTGGKICTHYLNFQKTLSMKVIDLDFRTCIDAL